MFTGLRPLFTAEMLRSTLILSVWTIDIAPSTFKIARSSYHCLIVEAIAIVPVTAPYIATQSSPFIMK